MQIVPLEGRSDEASEVDAGTFDEFFREHRGRLFGALAVMTGSRAEAEEVMQDAFLKVWERWPRVSTMENPGGFLFTTALNLYRKRLRRASVALRRATNLMPDDDAFVAIEARDEAMRLLRRLTPREREVIVLTGYLGYSTREAGRLLGIRGSTVRALTSRARAALRSEEDA